MALRLDKDRPTGSEAAQRVVQTAGDGDKFGRHRAVEVGSPEFCCPLERPILVEDDSLIDKGRPRQKVGKTGIRNGDIRQDSSCEDSDVEMTGNAQVSAHDIDEVGIALGGPDGGHVADEPKEETRDPQAQSDAKCGRERAVEDRDGARRTAHQDRLGQRAMNGRDEAWDLLRPSDHHSAAE